MSIAAFRVRSFRFQWSADLLASWATEMETVILGWYVITQTGSVVLLTVFGSLQFFGTLAAPIFGVLSDRVGARVMLCLMRSLYVALAALLLMLAATGWLTPVLVLVVAAGTGFVRPNDLVMRNSLIGETIAPAHLVGALGLSRATTDSARVGGALAGAGLSTVLGLGLTYVVVTTLYLASLALTFGIARRRPVPDPAAASRATSPARALKAGLARVLATPTLLALMWLAFLINLTAYPASGGLLPYVARRVYHVDATGLGWLVASFAFGGLLASMTMVLSGGSRHPERLTFVFTAIWYTVLLGFGHLETLGGGLLALLAAGFAQNVAMISMAATLLAAAGDEFRGRVMGVRQLAVYGLPVGLMAAGVLIERIGYPLTITGLAVTGLLGTVLIAIRWRASVWRRAYSLTCMSS
ncbi:MAG TPA: MFS transporter [Methylomirabilota bacterium]